jgi:hypothetical protein
MLMTVVAAASGVVGKGTNRGWLLKSLVAYKNFARWGHVAEWLRSGLQIVGLFSVFQTATCPYSIQNSGRFRDFFSFTQVVLLRLWCLIASVTVVLLDRTSEAKSTLRCKRSFTLLRNHPNT